MGLFQRLFNNQERKRKAEKYKIGMMKTRSGSLSSLKDILSNSREINEDLFDKLEEIFIMM